MTPADSLPLPDLVHFGRAVCGDLAQAERREWWLSNGRGGYAAGTVAGSLTRRYHGLLVAPVHPPLGRCLVVARADATLHDGEREWPLFTNRWQGGVVAPHGYRHIESFHLEGRMPVWRFSVGDAYVEQRIWMEPGAHTTCIAWRLQPVSSTDRRPRRLRVRLLVNARDHHGNTRPGDFDPRVEQDGSCVTVDFGRGFSTCLQVAGGELALRRDWYDAYQLDEEARRGLQASDAHLCVAEADLALLPDQWVGSVASLGGPVSTDLRAGMARFQAQDTGVLRHAVQQRPALRAAPAWIHQLVLAADSFLFARPLPGVPDGESVIAGYPWFGDWGRDTMIALPGLTLATGRHESARRILETFARFVDRGMLPNVFPGAGEHADYNSVDAALWYFEAWRAYIATTRDRVALARVFPVLESIIDWHRRGTRYRIGLDPADGLLRAGEPGVQITWMDAKIGDWVVTPRIGKPVEINALWYNALCVMAEFATTLGKDATGYETLAEQAAAGFARFVRPESAGLFDVLDGPDGDDASLRPNQILAVSLPHTPLPVAQQRCVVEVCARELLTSLGLRSLAPGHPDYRARYAGGVLERDGAYHQGPVWGWLLGHFAVALRRVSGDTGAALRLLEPVGDHLLDAALGSVSEIFDGDPPHDPRGAPAQAWSVACVLEAWWRLEQSRRGTTPVPEPITRTPVTTPGGSGG